MSEKKKESGENNIPIPIETESERMRRDIYRPDIEKLMLFTRMLKQNDLFKRAKIIHK